MLSGHNHDPSDVRGNALLELWKEGVYPWPKPSLGQVAIAGLKAAMNRLSGRRPGKESPNPAMLAAQQWAKQFNATFATDPNAVQRVTLFNGVVKTGVGDGWQWNAHAYPIVFPSAEPTEKGGIIFKGYTTPAFMNHHAEDLGYRKAFIQIAPNSEQLFVDTYCKQAVWHGDPHLSRLPNQQPTTYLFACDESGVIPEGAVPIGRSRSFGVDSAPGAEAAWLKSAGVDPRSTPSYSGPILHPQAR